MSTWKRLLIAWLFVPVQQYLVRLSGGRVLGRLEGTGALILVTKGRKSGEPRSSRSAVPDHRSETQPRRTEVFV